MGKISDALEKQKRDKTIKSQMLLRNNSKDSEKKRSSSFNVAEFIPQQKYNHKLVVLSAPDSVEAENFKVLRAGILFPKETERKRLIMITSSLPGEGKSFVAANLAASIAQGIDEHVLLVDCDFRRPSLHKTLGCSNKEGLHEYLTGRRSIPDLVKKTGIDKLSLITAGTPSHNPSELLGSIEMRQFFEEVRGRYDDRFIIVDAAPLEVTSEAAVLSNYMEGIIFVVMAGRAPRGLIIKRTENMDKEKMLGVVFNGYDKSMKSYDKYYKKYYK